MKQNLVVEDLVAAPGEISRGFVVVDESASGVQIRVGTILINGAGEGPTLLLTSGIHGDDLNTIPMLWRIAETVDPAQLRGQIIAVPVCNPPAFDAASHRTPSDHKTPNFPGSAQGTMSDRIGYHLYNKIALKADYVMDMHGGSVNSTLAVMAIVDGGADDKTVATSRAMAEAFNPDLIIVSQAKSDKPPAGLAAVSSRNGLPSLMIGMGQIGFSEVDTARGAGGVVNVMRYLNMLDGEPERVVTPRYTSFSIYYSAPLGGGFFPTVEAGQEVKVGDCMGTIHDVFGRKVGEVTTEISGVIEAIRFYPVISAGDWVATVAGF